MYIVCLTFPGVSVSQVFPNSGDYNHLPITAWMTFPSDTSTLSLLKPPRAGHLITHPQGTFIHTYWVISLTTQQMPIRFPRALNETIPSKL